MKMTVDENKSICRTISKETKFYLEHIIIYFERTFLVINFIKYLIKGGSHSKQAWVDMLLVWNIMKCENMTMQCWVTQTYFGLTQGEWLMGTLEAVELGHASEVTRLGHPDICYHEITNPNINLVHFSLQPKNLKCTSLVIQCQNKLLIGLSVIIRL